MLHIYASIHLNMYNIQTVESLLQEKNEPTYWSTNIWLSIRLLHEKWNICLNRALVK